MCILLAHFTSYHGCPYYISVHLQVGDRDTGVEQRLVDCINDAQCEEKTTEQACDLLRYKVRCLRKLLVCDVEMTDKELQDLICKIEEYKEDMAKAERQMEVYYISFSLCTCSYNGGPWCSWESKVSSDIQKEKCNRSQMYVLQYEV